MPELWLEILQPLQIQQSTQSLNLKKTITIHNRRICLMNFEIDLKTPQIFHLNQNLPVSAQITMEVLLFGSCLVVGNAGVESIGYPQGSYRVEGLGRGALSKGAQGGEIVEDESVRRVTEGC